MQSQTLIKIIAALEVVGGILGLIGVAIKSWQGGFTSPVLASASVGSVVFGLATFAGVQLWRNRSIGYTTSAVVQCAQLIKIAAPGFAFAICLSADFSVLWILYQRPVGQPISVLTFQPQVGAPSVIEFGRPVDEPQAFGISIVACVALVALRKGRTATERDDRPDDVTPAPSRAADQPDWVLPFWLKVAVGLFVLFVACCAGLLTISR